MVLKPLTSIGVFLAIQAPVSASSLPTADFDGRTVGGVSAGVQSTGVICGSVSLSRAMSPHSLVGVVVNRCGNSTVGTDLFGLYRLVKGDANGPSVGIFTGIRHNWPGELAQQSGSIFPFVGFALGYSPREDVRLRLALAYAPTFPYETIPESFIFLGGPPCSGFEAAYRINEFSELTAGINSRGDLIGFHLTL